MKTQSKHNRAPFRESLRVPRKKNLNWAKAILPPKVDESYLRQNGPGINVGHSNCDQKLLVVVAQGPVLAGPNLVPRQENTIQKRRTTVASGPRLSLPRQRE